MSLSTASSEDKVVCGNCGKACGNRGALMNHRAKCIKVLTDRHQDGYAAPDGYVYVDKNDLMGEWKRGGGRARGDVGNLVPQKKALSEI